MKTAETKTASTSHLHQTGQPFFQKNGESAFFSDSQTDLQTKPFFSKQETTPFIQSKLTIGRPGDKYEQEADAVAQKVVSSSAPTIQTKCSDCEEKEKLQKQSQPMEEEEMLQTQSIEEKEDLQMKPSLRLKDNGSLVDRTGVNPKIQNKINSSRGGGRSIDGPTRSFMESRMQSDFRNVNIHTGNEAIQMNRELRARAFTTKSDIYFNKGEYRPETTEGKKLLAHELTHVVQQKSNTASKIRRKVVDDDAHVPCRSTRAGAVETLRTAEEDAIKFARRAAVIIYVHRAFHPITQITGESTSLRAFRDVLWRRFHFDFNHPQVRDTLLPIWERRFELVADWISRLNHRYVCGAPGTEPPGECTTRPGEGYAWTATGVNKTQLCDDFWGRSPEDLAGSILHEWLHFGFGWLGDCEQRHNRNNTKCYDMFARELAGTATPSDYETCCTSPSDSLPPLAGTP